MTMRYAALIVLLGCGPAQAAEWGKPVNGLRVSLAVEAHDVVVGFQNTGKDMILPLGQILGGRGSPDLVRLHLVLPDGTRRRLRFIGGPGVITGQILPYAVPMMAGSLYTVRTSRRYWRLGSDLKRIDDELARGAALEASIEAEESLLWKFIRCYPVKIFWSGHAISNIARAPMKAQ